MSSIEQPKVTTVSAELPPAVTGPSVWYGPEISGRNDWIYQLTSEDVGEVEPQNVMQRLVVTDRSGTHRLLLEFHLQNFGELRRTVIERSRGAASSVSSA